MRLSPLVSFFFLQLMFPSQVRCEVMDMMPNAFDDQYKGCEADMEKEAPILLEKEKSYEDFRIMWDRAAEAWAERKSVISNSLPTGFKDVYGTAVVLYTMQEPHAIYQELNNNVSDAGQSRDYYMSNFHFKALHFYLTRALQLLKPNCKPKYITYRGTNITFTASDKVRFGQFASSSRNISENETLGTETIFTITTCFGADIHELSDFEEEEVLIPVYEKFEKVQQTKNLVTLNSTGERCSYFNCAYFGGKKRETPLCCADGREEAVPGSTQPPSYEIREKSTDQFQDSESKKAKIFSSDGREEAVLESFLLPSYEIPEKSTFQLQYPDSMITVSSAPGGNLSIPWISMVFAGLVHLFFYSGKQLE